MLKGIEWPIQKKKRKKKRKENLLCIGSKLSLVQVYFSFYQGLVRTMKMSFTTGDPVWVADCYFIVNVLDLPFASPIAIYR